MAGLYLLQIQNTYIYLLFLWEWAGRSRHSRLFRGSASYSGCSLTLWCCVHTHSPASPCQTHSCWHAGCTCTWDRMITTKDGRMNRHHSAPTESIPSGGEIHKVCPCCSVYFSLFNFFDRAKLKSWWVIWHGSCLHKASLSSPSKKQGLICCRPWGENSDANEVTFATLRAKWKALGKMY